MIIVGHAGRGYSGIVPALLYVTSACPVGAVLLGATPAGICAIRFGDATSELRERFTAEFPHAEPATARAPLRGWLDALQRHLTGGLPELRLPLDVAATPFQRRVWEALRSIPYGETRTYAEIARLAGNPQAVRAAASACGANPVAVAIPCHRVLRSDGGLGGYRWGLSRKAQLLALEKAKRPPPPAGAATLR